MTMDYIIKDFITGKAVRNIGAEATRQAFEKFLVIEKGYDKTDIRVDEPITVQFKGEDYDSSIDLIVFCKEKAMMAITCVAGSIGSYEREILAGARLIYQYQIPFAVSTDAVNAVILDTLTGKTIGSSLEDIPSKSRAKTFFKTLEFRALDENRKEREMIIYRSFNLEKVNI
ncbi:MAG: type I restriction enzyme HsdR N-terminal domain-containing protein [Proteobacteria bacterium]|nr:type I restriction enzyme HsdR N-terminal domain-containing protein [Pseudomonadota bacterium]MBU1387575.1 type I restriction enzyme HsdR N-terminal domain-containing protein [Pseudomonadota bacterium]MBU1544050.1 type I restriction enzyme HsdR N-terminal domain-containing protein [Pseudomonadota bacterium]MBU2479792.1 type I restriction enzyme HsdR N-terminal domain-containing protein [Pseudomonadota bacterium]